MNQSEIDIIKSNFEVSQHRFINKIIEGLQNKIGKSLPLKMSNKSIIGNKITIAVTARKVAKDLKELSDIKNNVDEIMSNIKNQNNFMDLIK